MRRSVPRRAFTTTLAFVLALTVLGIAPASAVGPFTEERLTNVNSNKYDIDIWGNIVVWADQRHGAPEIYMYDLKTGQETRLTNNDRDEWAPAIYGDKIVWTGFDGGPPEVFFYDISDGAGGTLFSDGEVRYDADIWGNTIVYEDSSRHADEEIYMYDLLTETETRLTTVDSEKDDPKIHGDRIAYEDDQHGPFNIWVHDLAGDAQKRLAPSGDEQSDMQIWGDYVVWETIDPPTNGDVMLYDFGTDSTTQLTSLDRWQNSASIYGGLVAWEDERHGSDEVYLHTLDGGLTQRMTSSPATASNPAVWGNRVAFEDSRDTTGNANVYVSTHPVVPTRAAGDNRYGTSAAISQAHVGSAKTVIVATGADFADALAASGLAGTYGAPLILTAPDALSTEAAAEIVRLNAQDAVIVGGTSAVSANVANALTTAGLSVTRIGGANRFDTSRLIANEIDARTGSTFGQAAFVVRGDDFADALSVSPAAYYEKMPILLVQPGSLPAETAAALTGLDIETGVVAGGTAAVGASVKTAVDGILAANGGAASARWSGANRYETSVEVASESSARRWASEAFVGLAVGNNFPDALSGGVMAGREYGVLVLTDGSALSPAATAFLTAAADDVAMLEMYGGTAVITDSVVTQAGALLK